MGATTAIASILASSSIASGVSSIAGGYAQSAEDKYNASLASDQAQALQVQSNITQGQYVTQAGQLASKQTAMAGAANLEPTGSIAAVMNQSRTNILTDAAIAKYNSQMAINYQTQQANLYNAQAKNDVFSGYSQGFSSMLKGASSFAMYKYGGSSGGGSMSGFDSANLPNFSNLQYGQ